MNNINATTFSEAKCFFAHRFDFFSNFRKFERFREIRYLNFYKLFARAGFKCLFLFNFIEVKYVLNKEMKMRAFTQYGFTRK